MNLLGAQNLSSGLTSAAQSAGDGSQSAPEMDSASLEKSFLTMLTAELRNQDPTNPMDSSQMVTQLSQISTSQGISNLENLSKSQIMAMMGNQRLESAQLIGKSVDYKTNSLVVDAAHQNYSGTAQLPSGSAGDLTVTIKDQSGAVVRTLTVPAGTSGNYAWSWDGKDDKGNVVAGGTYSISAQTKGGDKATLLSKEAVKQVDFASDGSTRLIFSDGQSADIQDVATIES